MTSVSEKCEGHATGSVITWFQWTCRADLSWDTRSFGNAKADTAAGESPRSLRLGPQVWELTLQHKAIRLHLTTDDYWYVWQYIQFDSVQQSNTANPVWNNAEKISAEAEHATERYGISMSVRLPATELCSESRTTGNEDTTCEVDFISAVFAWFCCVCKNKNNNTKRIVDAEQNTSPHFEGDDAFMAEKVQSQVLCQLWFLRENPICWFPEIGIPQIIHFNGI